MREPIGITKAIRPDSEKIEQWKPPSVSTKDGGSITDVSPEEIGLDEEHVPDDPMVTAAQLEEITQAAHEEGFEQGRKEGQEFGHKEGLEAAREEVREKLETLEQILNSLEKPFERLDDQVENEVSSLLVVMVRQLIRREIKMDPKHIIGVVREALAALPVSSRNIKVLLNPEDAEIVREAYTVTDADQEWSITEDPVLQRGGCKIVTENSIVDASLDSRLNAVIAPLLHGERKEDQESEEEDGAPVGDNNESS